MSGNGIEIAENNFPKELELRSRSCNLISQRVMAFSRRNKMQNKGFILLLNYNKLCVIANRLKPFCFTYSTSTVLPKLLVS